MSVAAPPALHEESAVASTPSPKSVPCPASPSRLERDPAADAVAALTHQLLMSRLVQPNTSFLQEARTTQAKTEEDLLAARQRLDTMEAKMKKIEATFGKLPQYIHKLELIQRNVGVLRDNAQKTKALAIKIAQDLNVTVAQPSTVAFAA